ncbi:unnamed protein product [Thlaspi arvense]|uniref:C3H1-type domain-containing protein n=1 Tax=Thlaspi arvense TaxID=13288 RepID=A0AAU9RTL7_THLAR|nr:unnamed protein product [Thlaspi arvense]CAH2051825.1 unnamed protein product [Thlaspi arvense]
MDVSMMLQNCSRSQSAPEWHPGLEEFMWRLGFGGKTYPVRPGAPDCAYYMRTGVCGFGNRCRYNHPLDCATIFALMYVEAFRRLHPERIGEPPCQFYLKTGTCKFGESCKFHHPKNAAGSMSHVSLKNAALGGTTVPPPPASPPQFYPSVQPLMLDQYGGPFNSLRTLFPGSYMQGAYGPMLLGVVSSWSPYSSTFRLL